MGSYESEKLIGFVESAFNGLHIHVLDGSPIRQVTTPTNTMAGLTSDRITFDEDDLYVNFQGLNFDASTRIVLDLVTATTSDRGFVAEDGRLTASGQVTISDPDAGEARFATPASLSGTYGSFTFDAATGAWGYTLDNTAAQALRGGQRATETLTVASLDGTATHDIVVTIHGANDAATIGGTATGTVAEDGTLHAAGQLTIADPDAGEAQFATPAGKIEKKFATPTSLAGDFGSFTFDAATGAWTYDLDNAAAQALQGDQSVTERLSIASLDGSATQDIVVTINGAGYDAVIAGTDTGSVTEDGTLTASGQLTITDRDPGQAQFATPASLAGTYGSFTFDVTTGAWTYRLDNASPTIQALQETDTLTDRLTVTSLDGTASRDIAVSIVGSDEPNTGLLGAAGTAVVKGGTMGSPPTILHHYWDDTLTSFTVGQGTEVNAWSHGHLQTEANVTAETIILYGMNLIWGGSESDFWGLHFHFSDGPAITGVTILESSVDGFGASRVAFGAHDVWANYAGLAWYQGTKVVLGLDFAFQPA